MSSNRSLFRRNFQHGYDAGLKAGPEERARIIAHAAVQLSPVFAELGDPRKGPCKRFMRQAGADSAAIMLCGMYYDAWRLGDWNSIEGVTPPPAERES